MVHSDLTDRSRALVWERCRTTAIRVLLGTRSAVWMPLPRLQLIIVDEEHDTSYKQQEGFRYSARDVAIVRAHRLNIPVVLGSATPSLESSRTASAGSIVTWNSACALAAPCCLRYTCSTCAD